MITPKTFKHREDVRQYDRRAEFLKLFVLNIKQVSREERKEVGTEAIARALDSAMKNAPKPRTNTAATRHYDEPPNLNAPTKTVNMNKLAFSKLAHRVKKSLLLF